MTCQVDSGAGEPKRPKGVVIIEKETARIMAELHEQAIGLALYPI